MMTRQGKKSFGRIVLAAALTLMGWVKGAESLTLSGTVTDSNQAAIPNIRVMVYDDDGSTDHLLATVYTDANGMYSAVVTQGWNGTRPDLYISVDWYFPLLPAATYGGRHVILLDRDDTPLTTFTAKKTLPVSQDPTMDLPNHNLQMDQAQANLGDLRQHINDSLDYYNNNRGNVAWSFNNDVMVHLLTTTITSSATPQVLNLAVVDITGSASQAGQGFISDIYHEMGHMVHFRANNSTIPNHARVPGHTANSEGNPTAALVEGWPSYVANLTSQLHRRDAKYSRYADTNRVHWRGNEMPAATGLDGSTFESGEVVEGALGGVWTDIGASTSFADNFGVLVNSLPVDIAQFLRAFVAQSGGAGSLGAIVAYQACNDHGIPYTRARFEQTAFMTDDPPDQGPPEDGNVKEIDSKLFLRGKVKANVSSLMNADLGVQAVLGTGQVGLYYKPAATGTGEAATGITQSFPFSAPNGGAYEFDTVNLGGTRGDGEWDLVFGAENQDSFRDNFRPSWMGDGNANVNSDEKYLKTIGAWYDKDRNPMTEDDGKVIVDNTAPKVENFKP